MKQAALRVKALARMELVKQANRESTARREKLKALMAERRDINAKIRAVKQEMADTPSPVHLLDGDVSDEVMAILIEQAVERGDDPRSIELMRKPSPPLPKCLGGK